MRFESTPQFSIFFYVHSVPFTEAVLKHQTSLGGSESACRVLAEALAARGHDVHIFATQLQAPGEYFGVQWHQAEQLVDVLKFYQPDVFVSLRMPHIFATGPIPAKLRILWTQDLLIEESVIGQLYSLDKVVFVSEYHREQWCNLQDLLRPLAWVTKNPIDERDVIASACNADTAPSAKIPFRLIHVSRPERGHDGLIALWPKIRERFHEATLAVCRYSSMYDAAGWGAVCADYDRRMQALNEKVGGIVFLGELDKVGLYREIAQSVAMLYPNSQPGFAETNCVAATESQACSTPIIASRVGALPETIAPGAGILIDGDPLHDLQTQQRFIDAVAQIFEEHAAAKVVAIGSGDYLDGRYLSRQRDGFIKAYDAFGKTVAAAWEQMFVETFEQRHAANSLAVLRQLLWEDNHAAARVLANDIARKCHESAKALAGPATEHECDEYRSRLVKENAEGLRRVREEYGDERAARIAREGLHRSLELSELPPDVLTRERAARRHAASAAFCEALEAGALCERVIKQEEQTSDQYAKYAEQNVAFEADINQRMHRAADRIVRHLVGIAAKMQGENPEIPMRPLRVLDVSCGNGAMALVVLRKLAEIFDKDDTVYHGIDYSQGVIDLARQATKDYGARVQFWTVDDSTDLAGFMDDPARAGGAFYDAIFCGEFIEHVERPWALLAELESCCTPGGIVMLTCPSGPFGELLERGIPRQRGHVHMFTIDDLKTMLQHKQGFAWEFLSIGRSRRGSDCGYWLFAFTSSDNAMARRAVPLDYTKTILTTRPYQRVNAMMIVRNGASWLRACLDSLYGVVDRIVIVDTGSIDGSIAIAETCGAEVHAREWPDDFSVARNMALDLAEPDAEWLLWIDADEQLVQGDRLRSLTVDAGPFLGYVVRQHHLALDQPTFDDKPVRLFRAGHGIRFFGVVHEQPELVMNQGVPRALDQQDVKIAHLGYTDEGIRRSKMQTRNLHLLMKEVRGQGTHPPRDLAWVLYCRDCINLATFDLEAKQGVTKAALAYARRVVGVYHEKGFDDPDHMLRPIVWPFYQQAIQILGNGVQYAWAFAAAPGRLEKGKQPRLAQAVALSVDEMQRDVEHQLAQWSAKLTGKPIDTEPVYHVAMPPDTLTVKQVRDIVRNAAEYSFNDDKRIMEWAALFLEAYSRPHCVEGEQLGAVLEIGTWRGASALVWLRLLKALDPAKAGTRIPVVTVDPYGGKPYRGGNGELGEALYGDAEFVAMKTLLAKYPNHLHFPTTSEAFLRATLTAPAEVWVAGERRPLDWFRFVLLDGEHAADTISRELTTLLGLGGRYRSQSLVAGGGIVVVDNTDADPRTVEMLTETVGQTGFELRPAKYGQTYAVIRVAQTAKEQVA